MPAFHRRRIAWFLLSAFWLVLLIPPYSAPEEVCCRPAGMARATWISLMAPLQKETIAGNVCVLAAVALVTILSPTRMRRAQC